MISGGKRKIVVSRITDRQFGTLEKEYKSSLPTVFLQISSAKCCEDLVAKILFISFTLVFPNFDKLTANVYLL